MKYLLLSIIVLASCTPYPPPNLQARVKISGFKYTDTINIQYYKSLSLSPTSILYDANGNGFATGVNSYSIIEVKSIK